MNDEQKRRDALRTETLTWVSVITVADREARRGPALLLGTEGIPLALLSHDGSLWVVRTTSSDPLAPYGYLQRITSWSIDYPTATIRYAPEP